MWLWSLKYWQQRYLIHHCYPGLDKTYHSLKYRELISAMIRKRQVLTISNLRANGGTYQTYGKRASRTLWPVSKGWFAGSFSVTGRTCRTGHTWTMLNFSFTPSNSSSRTTSCKNENSRILRVAKSVNGSPKMWAALVPLVERTGLWTRREMYIFYYVSYIRPCFFILGVLLVHRLKKKCGKRFLERSTWHSKQLHRLYTVNSIG